jgi:hypothetical protein
MKASRLIIATLLLEVLAASFCAAGPTEYGTVTVGKVALGAGDMAFDFESPQFGPFTLTDGTSVTFANIAPGDYAIRELRVPDWELYLVAADSTTSASDDFLDWTTQTFFLHLDAAEILSLTFHSRSLTPPVPTTPASIPAPSALLLGTLGAALIGLRRTRTTG